MKVIFYTVFVLFISGIHAQSYVDSGIQKYQAGEYATAILEFNKAYELRDALPSSSIARIFLYRGISKFEVFKLSGEDVDGEITVKGIYSDIDNSLKYENVWPAKLEEVKEELYAVVMTEVAESGKKGRKENDADQKEVFFKERIVFLSIASNLRNSSAIDFLLGETHKAVGDLYFESTEDLAKLQIAKYNYDESLKYYEIARYEDPYSKEIIKALLELSNRLGDSERVVEYEKLLTLAGG